MLIVYQIGIQVYYLIAVIISAFNAKAKAWVKGRRNQQIQPFTQSIWFHFASLGEFEQGRSVLEAVKERHPGYAIVVTFFSPSGYEIRKNTPLADAVYYLPLDTRLNARKFINDVKPAAAIFTKYEYWYFFYAELHRQQIPLYVISAIFRPKQIFFKWYGGLHRKMLRMVTHFFVQDNVSQQLLANLGIPQVSISGDTRFDRVWENAAHPRSLSLIESFKSDNNLFIAGSTWPADEELIAELVTQHSDWKFIIAPHEIGESRINQLLSLLPSGNAVKYSDISSQAMPGTAQQVLVIDNIGMLSALYQYGDIAYIGGGFGAGIHNTLEAAAFCIPVIFGPRYEKFKEARDLIDLGAGFSIANMQQLQQLTSKLITDAHYRTNAGKIAADYVNRSKGATTTIMNLLKVQ